VVRRIVRDTLIGFVPALTAVLVGVVVHAHLAVVLAAAIGVCAVALGALEGLALVRKGRLRRASARAGFQIEPRIRDKWIDLGVTNDSDQAAEFGASVEVTDPDPAERYERSWPIPWTTTLEERQVIDPHGTRYLQFGYVEGTPIEGDRQLSGSIPFRCAGRGDVSFNYDNKDKLARRVPAIKVTVRVYRLSLRKDATFAFLVGLRFGDGQDRALPWIEPVSASCR
jgi:hypothetical protein